VSDRQRVAHVSVAGVRGGLMRVVESLSFAQARECEVEVLSPLEPRWGEGIAPGWRPLVVRGNLDLGGHRALLRALRAFAPDVVVLHAGSPGELALAAALSARARATIVVEHAEHYPLSRPLRDLVLARLKRRATLWLSVSGRGARHLEQRWRLPDGVIGTIHNGVDEPPSGAGRGADLSFPAGEVVLGMGRPDARKGFDVFVETARRAGASRPGTAWVWVGATERRREGRVLCLPWADDVAPLLRRSSLLLIPSRAEGLPLVLLEAWACSVAVAASAVGGIPEVLEDGVSGLLLPAGEPGAWASAVGALLDNRERRSALARGGRERWQADYSLAAMVGRYRRACDRAVRLWPARG
jgi:glycosyltransferase involved in cell wall biosynthesis